MATIPNPYGYNDPTLGQISGNIAQILLGGESPNQRKLREAELGKLGAETGAADALARQRAAEAALNEQSAGARGDAGVLDFISRTTGADRGTVAAILGFAEGDTGGVDPALAQRLRDEYRTYAGIRMAGPGTQNIKDVNRAAFDASQMGSLLLGEAPEAVSMRTAAIEGKPMYDIKGDTFFSQYDPNAPMTTTAVGRMNAGKPDRPVEIADPSSPTGRRLVSVADALNKPAPAPAAADRTMSPGDAMKLDELVYMMAGGSEETADQFDPAALARLSARAAELVEGGMNPLVAAQQAVAENPLTEFDDGFFGFGAQPRTLATPSAPAAAPTANAAAPVRARNPQTGQVIELRNGQWVPL